jgi:hypothetical protein
MRRHHRPPDTKSNLFVSEFNFNDGVRRAAHADQSENPEFPDLYEGVPAIESVATKQVERSKERLCLAC